MDTSTSVTPEKKSSDPKTLHVPLKSSEMNENMTHMEDVVNKQTAKLNLQQGRDTEAYLNTSRL